MQQNADAQMTRGDSIFSEQCSIVAKIFIEQTTEKTYLIFAIASKILIIQDGEYKGIVVDIRKDDSICIVYERNFIKRKDKKILKKVFDYPFICNDFIYSGDSIVQANTIPLYGQGSYIYFTFIYNGVKQCEICTPIAGWTGKSIKFFDYVFFKYFTRKLYG